MDTASDDDDSVVDVSDFRKEESEQYYVIPQSAISRKLAKREKEIHADYIHHTELRKPFQKAMKEGKEDNFGFNILNYVKMKFDAKTVKKCIWVSAKHLPKCKDPTLKEIHEVLTYRGWNAEPDKVESVRKELKDLLRNMKDEAQSIIRRFIVYNCNQEGIRTECKTGNKIRLYEEVKTAFALCKDRGDVEKFVHAFILRIDSYGEWQDAVALALLEEFGLMLDKSWIQHDRKKVDCFHALASHVRNEEIKALNRIGTKHHKWNITKTEVYYDEEGNRCACIENERTRRTKGKFYSFMIIGDGKPLEETKKKVMPKKRKHESTFAFDDPYRCKQKKATLSPKSPSRKIQQSPRLSSKSHQDQDTYQPNVRNQKSPSRKIQQSPSLSSKSHPNQDPYRPNVRSPTFLSSPNSIASSKASRLSAPRFVAMRQPNYCDESSDDEEPKTITPTVRRVGTTSPSESPAFQKMQKKLKDAQRQNRELLTALQMRNKDVSDDNKKRTASKPAPAPTKQQPAGKKKKQTVSTVRAKICKEAAAKKTTSIENDEVDNNDTTNKDIGNNITSNNEINIHQNYLTTVLQDARPHTLKNDKYEIKIDVTKRYKNYDDYTKINTRISVNYKIKSIENHVKEYNCTGQVLLLWNNNELEWGYIDAVLEDLKDVKNENILHDYMKANKLTFDMMGAPNHEPDGDDNNDNNNNPDPNNNNNNLEPNNADPNKDDENSKKERNEI